MKTYTFRPIGVCSREMQVDLDDQDVVQALRFVGGCSGNLQGIASLVRGLPADEVIRRLKGINCAGRGTSCPDQLARGLEQALSRD